MKNQILATWEELLARNLYYLLHLSKIWLIFEILWIKFGFIVRINSNFANWI